MSQSYWVLGHLVTPQETIGDYGLLTAVTPAQTPGPPPHHHEDAAEFFHIISGSLEVFVDGERTVLNAGDSINVPVGAVHTFGNATDEDCHWFTAFSPRGFEAFFEEFGFPSEEANARERSVSEEVIGRVIQRAEAHGMIIDPAVLGG